MLIVLLPKLSCIYASLMTRKETSHEKIGTIYTSVVPKNLKLRYDDTRTSVGVRMTKTCLLFSQDVDGQATEDKQHGTTH
jgi:hypothetical protein